MILSSFAVPAGSLPSSSSVRRQEGERTKLCHLSRLCFRALMLFKLVNDEMRGTATIRDRRSTSCLCSLKLTGCSWQCVQLSSIRELRTSYLLPFFSITTTSFSVNWTHTHTLFNDHFYCFLLSFSLSLSLSLGTDTLLMGKDPKTPKNERKGKTRRRRRRRRRSCQ